MKKLFSMLLVALMCVSVNVMAKDHRTEKKANPKKATVVFNVEIDCQGCIDKIMKNIAFEKGVRDLRISQEEQQVTVVYNPQKTTVEALKAAFAKIGKPVSDTPLAAPAGQHHHH